MKKVTFITLGTTILLTACSSTTIKSNPPQKIDDLKHICIKESANPKLPTFTTLIAESLKQRGITSDIQTELSGSCRYALGYSVNKNSEGLIDVAKLRLSLVIDGGRKNLGEVSYWYRGQEEKAKVAQTGLKGQVDTLVTELLKNN